MTTSPLMLTEKDDELLGIAHRSDPMGVLAVWSARARDLVPHLTEQTTDVRGFQILVEAFRLWEIYEPEHPEHADRLDDFFLLIEQAFARIVGWHDHAWPLPGARSVKARASEDPHISLAELDWHLLGGQKANGLWGLYRGASRRAELLLEDMKRLSAATLKQATLHAGIGTTAQSRLFNAVKSAMDGATVALPTHGNKPLARDLYDTFWKLPLKEHLQDRLISSHGLNQHLAQRLTQLDDLDRRTFLTTAAHDIDEHRATIEDSIRCENLLAIVEAIFLCLCASKGKTLEEATTDLPLDLEALSAARTAFSDSGIFRGATAMTRHARFHEHLDTSSMVSLGRSVLFLHTKVSEERRRAAWVWEENGLLHSDADVVRPDKADLQLGLAWRNDYYLYPLKCIAKQLMKAAVG